MYTNNGFYRGYGAFMHTHTTKLYHGLGLTLKIRNVYYFMLVSKCVLFDNFTESFLYFGVHPSSV